MSPPRTQSTAVARGVSRLAFDAVEFLTGIVEGMHANIAATPFPLGRGTDGRTRGVTGFVYQSIRLVNAAARATLDGGLAMLPSGNEPAPPRPRAEAILSVLNGVLGDHLAATGNPLAIPMQLRCDGETLALERTALAAALPGAGSRLLVLVHGLCMNDRRWTRNGHDHGAALSRELGFTPLCLLYNTGRHVSENGRELAGLLEALLAAWPRPVEELVILAHSMGGLVARSACHAGAQAGHAWVGQLRKLVFLGTPHHGAPLERGGTWLDVLIGVSPYSAPLAALGRVRSAGITDLRYGNVRDEDWQERDRFERAGDRRTPLPLPAGVACYALAATLGGAGELSARLLGDGLVPLDSALGRHRDPRKMLAFPEAHCWIGHGMGHFDLLDRADVYARLRAWLA